MKKTGIIPLSLIVICLSFFVCGSVLAENLKNEMIKRLPVIKKLKAEGVIGENNRGYLEFVAGERKMEQVVQEENEDRRKVYAQIARRQNTSLEVVEKHRAAQIEKKARPGEWLQDANGKWYQKK